MLTDEQVKHNIADNIVRLLESRGWSQKQLADATGETRMNISRLCRAHHVPLLGTVARIAEAFDVSVDRLIGTPPAAELEKLRQPA